MQIGSSKLMSSSRNTGKKMQSKEKDGRNMFQFDSRSESGPYSLGKKKALRLTTVTISKYYCFMRRLTDWRAPDLSKPPRFYEVSPLAFLVDISNPHVQN